MTTNVNNKFVCKVKPESSFYCQCSNNDCKIIYHSFKIKTIIDKQTKQNTPTTFIVSNNKNNSISNSYELDQQNNNSNWNCKNLTIKNEKQPIIKTNELKKDGKCFKFKPSTHPKVREEQIKNMNHFDDVNNKESKINKKKNNKEN